MGLKNRIIIFLLFACYPVCSYCQLADTTAFNRKRFNTLVITGSTAYTITLIGLNELWFSNSARTAFHFFNDNGQWNQVDKLGHFFSAYYLSSGTTEALKWCGIKNKKAALWGSATGFLLMLPIEIMDGYSAAYGASAGDLIANFTGAGIFLTQSLLWNEPRIRPKFSFHPTHYAQDRPEVLGENYAQQFLKDYNGQTYWLSVDMDKFMRFPKWLNLAVGYGTDGMIYANTQPNADAGYNPHRQFYFALDFDLTSIKTKSKAVKTLLFFADMIKLPAPTLEFNPGGVRFYPFYF
jgi:uncharacterized protein YfiM (DUF2279 family)